MQFPEGNQFWKIRSKHGKDKLFKSPQLLWEAACEYFAWCDANPFIRVDFYGKDAKRCEVPVMRPYTLQGLCIYIGCSSGYFRTFKVTVSDDDPLKSDYLAVFAEIEEIIYNQKFSGAASGFFKENIIARDLGLKDQTEISGRNIKVEIKDE